VPQLTLCLRAQPTATLPTLPFDTVKANDEAMKAQVGQRQRDLLNERYDLSDRPVPSVMMSGGRKLCRAVCASSYRPERAGSLWAT
jgi:hypothetical protein